MDKRAVNMEKQRTRYYRSAKAIFRKALQSYNEEFIKEIRNATTYAQMQHIAEKPIRSESLTKAMKLVWTPISKQFGEQSFRELMPNQKAIDFGRSNPVTTDYWFAWVEKLLKGSLGQRITWIEETTKDVFKSVVDRIANAGFADGKSIQKIAAEMMKDLNITQAYRAERIARTEVISASNLSSQAGAQATGLELDKEWIAYIDDKTRESHIVLNGDKVDINDTFSNGLEVPGDPSGDAEEVINCRCTVGYAAKSDTEYSWGREI